MAWTHPQPSLALHPTACPWGLPNINLLVEQPGKVQLLSGSAPQLCLLWEGSCVYKLNLKTVRLLLHASLWPSKSWRSQQVWKGKWRPQGGDFSSCLQSQSGELLVGGAATRQNWGGWPYTGPWEQSSPHPSQSLSFLLCAMSVVIGVFRSELMHRSKAPPPPRILHTGRSGALASQHWPE